MAFIEVLNGNRFGDFKAEERKKRSNRAIRAFILKLVGYSQKGGKCLGNESIEK